MAIRFTRPISHNLNNRANPDSEKAATLQRMANVPTDWTPPAAVGIRQGGTDTIFQISARTPVTGASNPRMVGTRIVAEDTTRRHYFITG